MVAPPVAWFTTAAITPLDCNSKEYVYHPMACHPCIDVSRGKRGKSSDALGSLSIGSLQLVSSGRIDFSQRHYPVDRSRHPRELGWCRPQASLPRSWPTPELRIPTAAAQTRIVSKVRIRLDSGKSVRSFKGIICVDISEFESSHPMARCRLSSLNLIASYDEAILKQIKGPMPDTRPTSSDRSPC